MRFAKSSLIMLAILGAAGVVHAQTFDLVINNGRVMDPETMFDAVANVGIKDGRIQAITKQKIAGKETIDAEGLVVAPGFIDTHFHSVDVFATKMALRDGVTTGMDLEQGAARVGPWYEKKLKEGWQVNFGTTSSLLFNRLIVHDSEVKFDGPADMTTIDLVNQAAKDGVPGWSVTRSNLDQMNQIVRLMDEDLRQGAIGMGVGSAYMAKGLTTYEQFEVQRAAARYGRLTSVHTRFHVNPNTPTEAQIGVDEVQVNAMLLMAPLIIAHDNDYGWWEDEEKLRMARGQGYNVWGEYYPYTQGSTGISADFLQPPIWLDNYGYEYKNTIYDPTTDSWVPDRATYEKIVKEDPGRIVILEMPYRKPWISKFLRIPHMTVATDSMIGVGVDGKFLPWDADYSEYAGNPRTPGAMAKTLRLGREQGVPLMFTLAQLSYWSALHLGDSGLQDMKDRGRVQVGKIADLTLIDPDEVTDNSTMKRGEQGLPSTGLPYVIVNGTIVVKNNEVLPVKPGKPIRFPVEEKGRFKPVNISEWLENYTIPVESIHLDDTGAADALEAASQKK